jgi:membrane protease subunit HflC
MLKLRVINITLIALLLLAFFSLYTVKEGEKALLLRLGQIVTDNQGKPVVIQPGLHAKIPFIYQVKKFDMRLHAWDIESSRIVTAEQKDVIVDYYFKWRIIDPALYYTRTGGNIQQAQLLLEQQVNDSLRAEFGRRTISEAVSDERVDVMDALSQQADKNARRLGLAVIDVRIKRIDLPNEVSTAVYQRMRAERERIATEHRAEGKAEAEAIRAKAEANAIVIIATAKTQAANIRAAGDGEAAQIYAQAYSKDPGFYAFYRSLQAYKKTFANKNDIMVLQPDNAFLKYFRNGVESSGK